MSISYAIMAHPQRLAYVRGTLLPRLGPGVDLVVDEHGEGCWPTAKRAWLLAKDDYHVVMQDDILPCVDLVAALEHFASLLPNQPISAFNLYRKHAELARMNGVHWIKSDKVWGQCVMLPAQLIHEWLAWDEEYVKPECQHDDARLSLFLLMKGLMTWHPVPSLVEHIGHKSSLVGNHPPINRQAAFFIGPDQSYTQVNWERGLDKPIVRKSTSLKDYGGIIK